MTLSDFQKYVEEHAQWFEGVHPESPATLEAAERSLGYPLPQSLKWLLSRWGYSDGCGIDSLEEAVETTLRCRQECDLPELILVLNDWHDAGIVWMDRGKVDPRGESPIYWSGTHNFLRLGTGEPLDEDVDVFADYSAWVEARLNEAQEGDSYPGAVG